jgi:hypothetical protein
MRTLRLVMCAWFCLGLVACARPPRALSGATETPLYTPAVSLGDGTAMPDKTQPATVEQLLADPEAYLDQFVEVREVYVGQLERPDCEGYVGSPAEWGVYAYLPDTIGATPYVPLPFIKVHNLFDEAFAFLTDPRGYAVGDPYGKQMAVWGWWSRYEGPVGCTGSNGQGTPQPPDNQVVWYLNAVQLQFLESIEVTPAPP